MSSKNRNQIQKQSNKVELTRIRSEQYSGPLPHPETLQKFNEIVPGSADRIIIQFEEQSRHRREIEKKVIENDILLSKRGLIFGFLIAILAIVGGVYSALVGKELAGGFIGASGLIGLVAVFIYGTNSKRKQLKERSGD